MAKDEKWQGQDANLPDSWEAIPQASEENLPDSWEVVPQVEESSTPKNKRSFSQWKSPRQAQPEELQPEPQPPQPPQSSMPPPPTRQAAQPPPPRQEALAPSSHPVPVPPDPRLKLIQNEIVSLVARLPAQHAPSLPLLDEALSSGMLSINEQGQLDLLPLQRFFVENAGWSEHKFQTFCKPLVSQATKQNISIYYQEFATELPTIDESLPPPQTASEVMGRNPSIEELQTVRQQQPPVESVPAPTAPLTPQEKQAAIAYLVDCAQRSALKVMLNPEALHAYLEENIPLMWQDGVLRLQPMWDELLTIPMVSEPIVLSAFQEIDKNRNKLLVALELPEKVRKSLAKSVSSVSSFREQASPTPAPHTKHIERPLRPKPTKTKQKDKRSNDFPGDGAKSSSSTALLGLALLLALAGAGYYFFFATDTVKVVGTSLDTKIFAKILPAASITNNKKTGTAFVKVTSDFMGWEGTKRIKAIYELKKVMTKKYGVRRLRII